MKTLIILRGIPGCGKTTTADLLVSMGAAAFSADEYFVNRSTGEYEFDATKLHSAHLWCQGMVELYMTSETETIVVHNTNTTAKEMKPYYKLAEKYGYQVHSLIVENRHDGKNVHDVPEEILERMEQRFDIRLRGKT